MSEKPENKELEAIRLANKYGRSLSPKQLQEELGISSDTYFRRLKQVEGIPHYKEFGGKKVFPISAVADFLTTGLVKTY